LERASTEDRWWEALVQGLAVFDLAAIRWTSGGAKREHRRPEAAATWSFRVQVTPADAVELEGDFSAGAAGLDFVAFTQAAIRTFPANCARQQEAAAAKVATVLP
jgi:hypothetical protein